MKTCPWCNDTYDNSKYSSAFCDLNPNRERNVKRYFVGDKRFRKVRRAAQRSLDSLVTTPVLVLPPSPFRGKQ